MKLKIKELGIAVFGMLEKKIRSPWKKVFFWWTPAAAYYDFTTKQQQAPRQYKIIKRTGTPTPARKHTS